MILIFLLGISSIGKIRGLEKFCLDNVNLVFFRGERRFKIVVEKYYLLKRNFWLWVGNVLSYLIK